MSCVIRTGNRGLAQAYLPLQGHSGEAIPIVHDPIIPDWQWGLFDGDRLVGTLRDIGENVGKDLKAALQRHQERKPPPVEPTMDYHPAENGQLRFGL